MAAAVELIVREYNTNGGNEESQYSTCRQAHEDDDHLFQCPKRPAYRKKILEALNTIKKGMCPTLYYLFSNSILNYIDGHDRSMASHPLIAPDPNTLDEYNTLLTQQARIGWDHLLRGKYRYSGEYTNDTMNANSVCNGDRPLSPTPNLMIVQMRTITLTRTITANPNQQRNAKLTDSNNFSTQHSLRLEKNYGLR